MKKIPSFVWIVITVVVGVGFLLLLVNNRAKNVYEDIKLPVQVEVYSDYNCPHCADFSPFVKDVEDTYGEKVNVEKKHLPFLADSSYSLAYAAEAAREQDKFDEFDSMLFKWASFARNPNNTSFQYSEEEKANFTGEVDPFKIAALLKMDIDKFTTDLSSDTVKNRVTSQKADIVKKLGTQSTPTVLVYGQELKMTGFEDLKTEVGRLIESAEKSK